ncbi:MAG: hypothetical protein A2W22_06910 [Candidatus Levybacteria bacterium RBG_16_35_11]|nr:MAG: hypothetical protein A2W22_06910 [Candidatus Levybacteria bacterium RBG_16_35_11]
MNSIEKVKDVNMPLPVIKITNNRDMSKGQGIYKSRDVYEVMKFISKADREFFYVLHLSAKLRLIAMELVSIGSLNNSTVQSGDLQDLQL